MPWATVFEKNTLPLACRRLASVVFHFRKITCERTDLARFGDRDLEKRTRRSLGLSTKEDDPLVPAQLVQALEGRFHDVKGGAGAPEQHGGHVEDRLMGFDPCAFLVEFLKALLLHQPAKLLKRFEEGAVPRVEILIRRRLLVRCELRK